METIYLGPVSEAPLNVWDRFQNEENVFAHRAQRMREGVRESYGHNPDTRFAFFNDSGGVTTIEGTDRFHHYGYHSYIHIFEVTDATS